LTNFHFNRNYSYRPISNYNDPAGTLMVWAGYYASTSRYTAARYATDFDASSHLFLNQYDASNLLYKGTSGADKYKTLGSHRLDASYTIANGGIGGSHPYLPGVTIPSYVGATNPNDNAWVNGVLGLNATTTLIDGTSGDAVWIEGFGYVPPPPDITAPSVPLGLTTTAISSSQINLSWSASTDYTGVTGYRIYRGSSRIATTSSLSYSNIGLTASTLYSYTVSAYDAAGNVSASSSPASVTTVAVSSANNSTPSSSGGGGGGGSIVAAPSTPTNFSAANLSGQINLSWTNPTSNFSGVKLYRKTNSAPTGQTDSSAKLIYQGNAHNFLDASTTLNTLYYYSLYSYNSSLSYSSPATVFIHLSAPPATSSSTVPIVTPTAGNSSANSGSTDPGDVITTLISASSAVVNQVTAEETGNLLAAPAFVNLSDIEKTLYGKITVLAASPLGQDDKYAIADFIHFGTPTTKILGAGERAGSIASFNSAFGKMPVTNADWQDVIKIGNGRWTTQTSAAAMVRAKINFQKVYLRVPNMANSKDNNAVNIMAYGLRPAARNTASEKSAILSFKHIFKKIPTTAVDWDEVRAIAYSGAKR
jgi:hypothetical protein